MDPNNNRKKISVNHVHVRLSISFLLLKLAFADLITTIFFAFIYTLLITTASISYISPLDPLFTITVFILVTLIETFLTLYIILEWLSNFYEISPYAVTHKYGVIFKKEDRWGIQNIKQVGLEQGLVGNFLNYGSIVLFDWRLNKYAELYCVHNPLRHVKILEQLLPNIDEHKSTIREHLIEKDND